MDGAGFILPRCTVLFHISADVVTHTSQLQQCQRSHTRAERLSIS